MKKILVVDDTKSIRALLSKCLEMEGYEVSTAKDGQEALNLIKDEKFDLIFLDIKMPEISGTEVLRRIRAMGITVPVVIITAFATVKNAIECTKLGAVTYLQKPFTAEKIRNILKDISNFNCEKSDNIDLYISKSKELIDSNEIDEAYELLKKALSLNPSCSEVYYLIGKIHEMKADLIKAEKFYEVSKQFEED